MNLNGEFNQIARFELGKHITGTVFCNIGTCVVEAHNFNLEIKGEEIEIDWMNNPFIAKRGEGEEDAES